MMKFVIMGAATALTALTFTVAAGASEPQQYRVAIDDLDLGSSAGIAAFDARIADAAKTVCKRAYRGDNLGLAQIRQCRSEVIAAAAPQRSRAYAAHRGNEPVLAITLRVAAQ